MSAPACVRAWTASVAAAAADVGAIVGYTLTGVEPIPRRNEACRLFSTTHYVAGCLLRSLTTAEYSSAAAYSYYKNTNKKLCDQTVPLLTIFSELANVNEARL